MIGYLSMFGYLFLKQLCVTGLCRDGALFAFFQPCSPEAGWGRQSQHQAGHSLTWVWLTHFNIKYKKKKTGAGLNTLLKWLYPPSFVVHTQLSPCLVSSWFNFTPLICLLIWGEECTWGAANLEIVEWFGYMKTGWQIHRQEKQVTYFYFNGAFLIVCLEFHFNCLMSVHTLLSSGNLFWAGDKDQTVTN